MNILKSKDIFGWEREGGFKDKIERPIHKVVTITLMIRTSLLHHVDKNMVVAFRLLPF